MSAVCSSLYNHILPKFAQILMTLCMLTAQNQAVRQKFGTAKTQNPLFPQPCMQSLQSCCKPRQARNEVGHLQQSLQHCPNTAFYSLSRTVLQLHSTIMSCVRDVTIFMLVQSISQPHLRMLQYTAGTSQTTRFDQVVLGTCWVVQTSGDLHNALPQLMLIWQFKPCTHFSCTTAQLLLRQVASPDTSSATYELYTAM